MKKYILIFLLTIIFISQTVISQNVEPNIELPIDEKIKLYFDTFRDGNITQGASRFASYIAREFRLEVIPHLKLYMKNADFFNYNLTHNNSSDLTLGLIAHILHFLHLYSHPTYSEIVEPYTLDKRVVQWFVDQYKAKIDQYILTTRLIDNVVMIAEDNLSNVAGYVLNWEIGRWVGGNEIENYGHPDFYNRDKNRYRIDEIKKYYEERLGIEIMDAYVPN